jgi:hypothetical protein
MNKMLKTMNVCKYVGEQPIFSVCKTVERTQY